MIRETAYDEVFHAQRHFRSLLDSLSRPGTINDLSPVLCTPPDGLYTATALVAFALMNADVSFHLVNMPEAVAAYLTANTNAKAAPIEAAAFVIANGHESPEAIEGASCGTLAYPDTSATLILQVKALSQAALAGCTKLTLQGPGIDGRAEVFAGPLNVDLLLVLQARNAEYPLGIDTILTADRRGSGRPRVLGLPRTTKVSWQIC